MMPKGLDLFNSPQLHNPRLILSFSGWMDGGEVSTGTMEYLVEELGDSRLGEIKPQDFYIYNFPGSMEFSSLFRPHCRFEDGILQEYQEPKNIFHYSLTEDLILFIGKEPNLNWHDFAECIMFIVSKFNVAEMYFIGSVSGLVPHTREPRFTSGVSSEALKERFKDHNIRFSDYEGPGSFTTYLMHQAMEHQIDMVSLVAEIPAYLHGRNVKCIESILKRLAKLLKLNINLDQLRVISDDMEKKLNDLINENAELEDHIRKLEENYDRELFDTDMSDLKDWLEGKGIRLD